MCGYDGVFTRDGFGETEFVSEPRSVELAAFMF